MLGVEGSNPSVPIRKIKAGVIGWNKNRHPRTMSTNQSIYEKDFPSLPFKWVADCKNQTPDLGSQYFKDEIENNAIYVAGPSGMTSLLLGQMETLANLENEDLKKNYLTAIAIYIVAEGKN